jgi:hypothetical protein
MQDFRYRMLAQTEDGRPASDQNATPARPVARRQRRPDFKPPQPIVKIDKFGASGTIRTSDRQIRCGLEQIQNEIFQSLFLFAFSHTSL